MADPGETFLAAYFQNHNALMQRRQFETQQAFAQNQLAQTDRLQNRQMDQTDVAQRGLEAFRNASLGQGQQQIDQAGQAAGFARQLGLGQMAMNPDVAAVDPSESGQPGVFPIGEQLFRPRTPDERSDINVRAKEAEARSGMKLQDEQFMRALPRAHNAMSQLKALGYDLDPDTSKALMAASVFGPQALQAATNDTQQTGMNWLTNVFKPVQKDLMRQADPAQGGDPRIIFDPKWQRAVNVANSYMKDQLAAGAYGSASLKIGADASKEAAIARTKQILGDLVNTLRDDKGEPLDRTNLGAAYAARLRELKAAGVVLDSDGEKEFTQETLRLNPSSSPFDRITSGQVAIPPPTKWEDVLKKYAPAKR